MKVLQKSMLFFCFLAHTFTQPASAFASEMAGQFAKATFTKKNLALVAGFAVAEYGAKKLLVPGNPVSDRFQKSITTYMRNNRATDQNDIIKSSDETIKDFSSRKPNPHELELMKEVLKTRPDRISSQEMQEMMNYTVIFKGSDEKKIVGFVCPFHNYMYIHEDMFSNQSELLHTMAHEWQHRQHRDGHRMCALASLFLPFISMPIVFNLISKKTLATRTIAAIGSIVSFDITARNSARLVTFNFDYNEEKRADTRAIEVVSCAGCADKIVALKRNPKLSPEKNRINAKAFADESGYVADDKYTDPEWLKLQRQSCALCLPIESK